MSRRGGACGLAIIPTNDAFKDLVTVTDSSRLFVSGRVDFTARVWTSLEGVVDARFNLVLSALIMISE